MSHHGSLWTDLIHITANFAKVKLDSFFSTIEQSKAAQLKEELEHSCGNITFAVDLARGSGFAGNNAFEQAQVRMWADYA